MAVFRSEETGKRHRDKKHYKFSGMGAMVWGMCVYWGEWESLWCPSYVCNSPVFSPASCWGASPGNALLSLHLHRWKRCIEIVQCSMALSFFPVWFVVLLWPRAFQCLSSSQKRSWHSNMLPWREETGEMSIFILLHEKKNLLYEKILFQGLLLPTDPAVGEFETLAYIIPFLI